MSEKHCLCENTTESRSLGYIYVKSCKNHKNLKVHKKIGKFRRSSKKNVQKYPKKTLKNKLQRIYSKKFETRIEPHLNKLHGQYYYLALSQI